MKIQGTDQTRQYMFQGLAVVVIAAIILLLPEQLKMPAFLFAIVVSLVVGIAWMRRQPVSVSAPPLELPPLARQPQTITFSSLLRFPRWLVASFVVDVRNRRFVIGFGLLILAHYLMDRLDTAVVTFTFTNALNDFYRVGVPNMDNVILGTLVLAIGCFYILRGLTLNPLAERGVISQPWRTFPSFVKLIQANLFTLLAAFGLFATLFAQVRALDKSNSLIVIWLLVIAAVLTFGFKYDREAKIALRINIKRWDAILMLAIFAGALLINCYQLDQIPNSVVGDEGAFLERAKTIAQGNEQASFFDVGVYTYPLASTFYQGLILKIFGISVWSWRFASVLIAVLTVFPLYLLALALFDRRTAVIACIVMVVTPYFVAFARMGYNNSQSLLPVTLTMSLLYLAIERESLFYFMLSGMTAALGFYSYNSAELGAVAGFVFLVYMLIKRRRAIAKMPKEERPPRSLSRQWLFFTAIYIVSFLVVVMPHIVYVDTEDPTILRSKTLDSLFNNSFYALSLYQDTQLYRDYAPIKIDDQTFFFRPDLYGILLIRGFIRTALAFDAWRGLNDSLYVLSPLPGPIGGVFYLLGLLVTIVLARRNRQYALVLIWFVCGVIFLSILDSFPPRHTHMVAAMPAMILLVSIGIVAFVDFLGKQLSRPLARAVMPAASVVIVAIIAYTGLYNYYVAMPQVYKPDVENVIQFQAIALQKPHEFIFINQDPGQKDYVPSLVRTVETKADFHTMTLDALTQAGIQPDKDYTFYFDPKDQEAVLTYLDSQFGTRGVIPTIFNDTDGNPILMSWTIVRKPA